MAWLETPKQLGASSTASLYRMQGRGFLLQQIHDREQIETVEHSPASSEDVARTAEIARSRGDEAVARRAFCVGSRTVGKFVVWPQRGVGLHHPKRAGGSATGLRPKADSTLVRGDRLVTVSFSKGRCNRLPTCTGFGNGMQVVGPCLPVTAPHSRD